MTEPSTPTPLDYANTTRIAPENTIQEVDVGLLYIFACFAFVMSLLFVAAVPLCVIALWRNADVVIWTGLICALAMSVGLIGTGVGLIRRARRAGRDQASARRLESSAQSETPDTLL